MPSMSPPVLLRCAAGAMLTCALLCASLWAGEPPSLSPKVLTSLWEKHIPAQLTGLDLTWDGQTVAFTSAPSTADGNSHLHIYDLRGREQWAMPWGTKILGVSLSGDGHYTAIGSLDLSIVLFARDGVLLWERKSVGLPYLTPQAKSVVAFNSGITGPSNTLLEVFNRHGAKIWSMHRKGRVWRSIVSDQGDLLIGLWTGEVLFVDRQRHLVWQHGMTKEIMALAISPGTARYFAVAAGVLDQVVHLYERTGRLLWRRQLPLGATELSLAPEGEWLLSYGNTIHGQRLAVYSRKGDLQWTYHLAKPATESSKAVIVPHYPLVVAGIERDQRYYLQGFTLTGELLWMAPVSDPIFDFRVSRDGRYIAAATDRTLYFFDTRPVEGPQAEFRP